MLFHTVESLGTTRFLTPEGYLVCIGVPLARTGELVYADGELPGLQSGPDGLLRVSRDNDVVFEQDAMASFVAKPVVDDHPDVDADNPEGFVGPKNWRQLAMGTVQHVRRGEGAQTDLMLGDLLIMDPDAIKAVNSGKREISIGYDAEYEQTGPGRARQHTIRGNHVALVENGRCGPRCAIGDSALPRKDKSMATKTVTAKRTPMARESVRRGTMDRLRTAFRGLRTKDAEVDPDVAEELAERVADMVQEAVEEAVNEAVAEADGTTGTEATDAKGKDEDPGMAAAIAEALKPITDRLDAIEAKLSDKKDDPEATTDAEADPEEKKAMAAKDSSGLVALFQDVMARAEILAPGISLPTYDAKSAPKATVDALCGLRRRAMLMGSRGAAAEHIAPMVAGQTITAMTCDAIAVAFNGASEAMKRSNRSSKAATQDSAIGDDSIIVNMKKTHDAFWART